MTIWNILRSHTLLLILTRKASDTKTKIMIKKNVSGFLSKSEIEHNSGSARMLSR